MKIKYITYTTTDEVIITLPSQEKKMIKLYFTEGGRDIMDYDRDEINEFAISIAAHVKVN